MALYAWKIVLLLLSSFCFNVSSGALDATAVLLECEEGSSIDDVYRTEPPYHTIDNCIRKIRITLNISNTGKTPQDLDYSFLSQLSDPETGKSMYLLNPVVLRLRQDQVLLAYPFHYISAVNGKAMEIVVNYANTRNFTGCDDTSRINPTCGLKHDRGKAIPFSQGFCCFCPETPARVQQPRGGQDCSLDVGDPTDAEKQKYKASAHCLHYSDLWYSVSALSEPFILHETFMQVYNQRHLKSGASVWAALTHDEDFELGPENTYQYDDNKTIVISYMTSSARDDTITVPISDRRLLTPQPMPAVGLANLPAAVRNGAADYLLLPEDIISPYGADCDVAGVSYEAFAKQPDRCNVAKDTCLKNQPLDFWTMDDEKRRAGTRGSYLLQNFAFPYKDPIIVHPETKEHWLATEYHSPHVTVLIIEIKADEIAILTVGKYAQISKATTSVTVKTITFYVSVLNRGLMPANFTVQAVKCAFGVPDSSNESVIIPPQMTEDVKLITRPGSTTLDEEFACTVQVSSAVYGVVATREVTVNPLARCICNFHCECACLSDTIECELMSEEDYHAAGFRGSLPVLTAKPPKRLWFIKHPFLALLAFILFFLLFGLIKGLLGLVGCRKLSNVGMDKFLYQPKKIKRYLQPELKNINVVYDAEGYPIHPDTRERVRVISDELLFAFNCLFLFYWPCVKCRQGVAKVVELKKKRAMKGGKDDPSSKKEPPRKKDEDTKGGFLGFFGWGKKKEGPPGKNPPGKNAPGRLKPPTDKGGKGQKKGGKPPGGLKPPTDRGEHKGFSKQRGSTSDINVSSGPAANPLNKRLEQWQKGKTKIGAVTK